MATRKTVKQKPFRLKVARPQIDITLESGFGVRTRITGSKKKKLTIRRK